MNSFLWSYAFRDLFRQKTRTILGIVGVSVSLFLLTTVSFITDTISYSYINYVTADSGNQDMVFSIRHYATEPPNRTSFFPYEEISEKIRNATDQIEHFIPRLQANGSRVEYLDPNMTISSSASFCALNFSYEDQIGFGRFTNIDQSIMDSNRIPDNSCLISAEYALFTNLSVGDSLFFYYRPLNTTIPLQVVSIYSHFQKFPLSEEPNIVVDLNWWVQYAPDHNNNARSVVSWGDSVNRLILILKDAQTIYDIRDVAGTEKEISDIGAIILLELGIEAYRLSYPKLELLFISEFLSFSMNILFLVITLVTMLISGILINSILSTSVEERIREYGINRVLGARKNYNLKLIIIQSSILCIFGTTIGILFSAFFVNVAAVRIIDYYLVQNNIFVELVVVLQPESVLISYAIGIGVSMLVSIAPALKVMGMKIVESINPYRSTDEVFKLEKEGGMKYRLIINGIILSLHAGSIYFLIPRVLLSLELRLLGSILIITLLLFLIGVSLIAIGFMPFFIRVLVKFFEPFNQKLINIIKITVHRHQRRNLSTIIMFVLSFSFIVFTTSMVQIQLEQVGGLIRYEAGSDIYIRPDEYTLNSPTIELATQIMEIDGIERTSAIIASAYDLENIYFEEEKEFEVQIGDYINFASAEVRLFGVDENFKDTLYDQSLIQFSEGTPEQAFQDVYNETAINIIIAASIASDLKLHLGDIARLTFQRGTEEEPFLGRVVGVAKSMPGTQGRFAENGLGTAFRMGGVLISSENYNELC